MYQAWVKEIDITKLLGTKDLAASDGIQSLFDATAIDVIANEVIHAEHPPKWKPIPYTDTNTKHSMPLRAVSLVGLVDFWQKNFVSMTTTSAEEIVNGF
jgi:hypothetical protein